ncbi:unnamed protein product [Scytosiphon promiscuus]
MADDRPPSRGGLRLRRGNVRLQDQPESTLERVARGRGGRGRSTRLRGRGRGRPPVAVVDIAQNLNGDVSLNPPAEQRSKRGTRSRRGNVRLEDQPESALRRVSEGGRRDMGRRAGGVQESDANAAANARSHQRGPDHSRREAAYLDTEDSRREAARRCMAARRSVMSPASRERQREAARDGMAARRSRMSSASRERQREAHRRGMAARRDGISPGTEERRREAARRRMAAQRSGLSPASRERQREAARQRKAARRDGMSSASRERQREADRQRVADRRDGMSSASRERQREADRQRKAARRDRMSPASRERQREADRQRMAARRSGMSPATRGRGKQLVAFGDVGQALGFDGRAAERPLAGRQKSTLRAAIRGISYWCPGGGPPPHFEAPNPAFIKHEYDSTERIL